MSGHGGSGIISCVAIVPRGAAKQFPDQYEMPSEAIDVLTQQAEGMSISESGMRVCVCVGRSVVKTRAGRDVGDASCVCVCGFYCDVYWCLLFALLVFIHLLISYTHYTPLGQMEDDDASGMDQDNKAQDTEAFMKQLDMDNYDADPEGE
jgi:hypothetical protein